MLDIVSLNETHIRLFQSEKERLTLLGRITVCMCLTEYRVGQARQDK